MSPDPTLPAQDRLDVYHGALRIGSIFDTEPLSFEYSGRWLEKSNACALPGVPLGAGRMATDAVAAVFDNLLPEGALRDYLVRRRQASTVFALLKEVAGDTAGGLVILNAGDKPARSAYQKTTWQSLAALLDGQRSPGIDIHAKDARISLSGAQNKVLIALDRKGNPMLPLGETPSTHILKPDIRMLQKVHHSAANEAIVMLAAANAGMEAAEIFYEPLTGACVVKRFDRVPQRGRLTRLMQYDLCQLNGTLSDKKYESEGGPGIVRCAQLIREYSTQSAVDLLRLLEWVFFNLYVGNNDSHAKNLSIYFHPRKGTMLTPFYDLMCTRVYSGLSGKFALAVGGENLPGKIGRQQVVRMAEELGVKADYALGIAEQMAGKTIPALDAAISQIAPALSASGKVLAQKMRWEIGRISKQTSVRILKSAR